MTRRPRIAVSVSERTGWRVFPFFQFAVWRAGGQAVRFQTTEEKPSLDGMDGLIIGGGDDLHFDLYGGKITQHATFDRARDALEIALIAEAEERHLPMMGVCRGMQLINVVRGGTLHQEIAEAYPDMKAVNTPLPRKEIQILPGTRLADIKGAGPSMVNALHHQSIDKLGEDICVSARDDFGIVQAIESTRPRLVIGVQWHPEYLVLSRRDHKLFSALAEAAS